VDDEPAAIARLSGMLPEHHTCLAATNGVTALELAQRCLPDLIILDAGMPGMDGYEVCRLLKENQATALIPVIILTSEAKEIAKDFTAEEVECVDKSLSARELNARVNSYLHGAEN
jgi:putative two-component system response regulator